MNIVFFVSSRCVSLHLGVSLCDSLCLVAYVCVSSLLFMRMCVALCVCYVPIARRVCSFVCRYVSLRAIVCLCVPLRVCVSLFALACCRVFACLCRCACLGVFCVRA